MITDTPLQNTILETLTLNKSENILASVEEVQVFFGEILYESDEESPYVYFPTSSVISLYAMLNNGESSEIAVVGRDGGVGIGIASIINGKTVQHMAMITKSGISYRLKKQLITEKLNSLLSNAFNTRTYHLKPRAKIEDFAA